MKQNNFLLIGSLVILSFLAMNTLAAKVTSNSCLNTCRRDYFTDDRPSPCCGCCNTTSTCHESDLYLTCCPEGTSFCGCTDDRCLGYIGDRSTHSRRVAFGTCFDPNNATCTYQSDDRFWLVCPKTSTPCLSASFSICCPQGHECLSEDTDPFPICSRGTRDVTAHLSVLKSNKTSDDECPPPVAGSRDQCCDDSYRGAINYNTRHFDCTTNQAGQRVLCPRDFQSC
eukprot:TRINITY_DN19199_c0_g1_i1.p1 TRINITY_DN19199_c0_g1~~TRINITY_DN19199_c0_g1_i1.p1  ORF type:complete len:227 (+),score=33.04 TRINITY_DN19199_c0_g1_i1:36-716(+)